MRGNRTAAIVLLVVIGVGGLATAAGMFGASKKDAPPAFVPFVVIVCSVATLAAAFGLYRREGWAIPLGVGSRAIDGLLATVGIFMAPGVGPKVGAAVDVVLSVAAIVMLRSLQDHPTSAPR